MPEINAEFPLEEFAPPPKPPQKPEPMEYTGEPCRCGKHRSPGNPEEANHQKLMSAWKQNELIENMAQKFADAIHRQMIEDFENGQNR